MFGKLARAGAPLLMVIAGFFAVAGTAMVVASSPAGADPCPTVPPKGTWQGTWQSSGASGSGTVTASLNIGAPDASGVSKITGMATVFVPGYGGVPGPITGSLSCSNETFGATLQGQLSDAFSGTVDPSGMTASGTYTDTLISSNQVVDTGTWQTALVPVIASVSPPHGPGGGGNNVTIHSKGKSFYNVSAVYFGATQATNVTVVSPTKIIAVAPPEAAGTVDVTVVSPGGTSAISQPADSYTYLAPVVKAVSPKKGLAGSTIIVKGKYLSGATAVTFNGIPGTNVSVLTGGKVSVVVPAGTGTVDVQVTTAGGTSPIALVDHFTYS
jgi:hypothetical protein